MFILLWHRIAAEPQSVDAKKLFIQQDFENPKQQNERCHPFVPVRVSFSKRRDLQYLMNLLGHLS